MIAISNITRSFPKAEEIPSFSYATKVLFEEQSFELPKSVCELRGRVEKFTKTEKKLQEAKTHCVRDRLVSVLASAFLVAIIVGGILGAYYMRGMYGGLLSAGLGTATGITAVILGAVYFNKWFPKTMDRANEAAPCIWLVGGPFVPLLRTFGRIARYEKSLQEKKGQIEEGTKNGKKFFKDPSKRDALVGDLTRAIDQVNLSLKNMQASPITSLDSERALSLELQKLEKAHNELMAAIKFFNQD